MKTDCAASSRFVDFVGPVRLCSSANLPSASPALGYSTIEGIHIAHYTLRQRAVQLKSITAAIRLPTKSSIRPRPSSSDSAGLPQKMTSAAYHAADAFSPHLDIAQRGQQNFFATPRTPVTTLRSSAYFGSAANTSTTTTDRSYFAQTPNPSNISRKRPRYERSESSVVAHSTNTPPSSADLDGMSPMPLVNTDYRLACGLDTPTAVATSRLSLYNDLTPDFSMRRGRGFGVGNERKDYFHDYNEEDVAALPGRSSNGRAPAAPTASASNYTLGGMVFGLAGKIWGFCTTSFQGFYAGSGQGYSLDKPKPPVSAARPPPSSRMESSTWIDVPQDSAADQDSDSDSDRRRSKKSKTAHHTPDLRESWVMVNSPERARMREASPSSFSLRSPETPGLGNPRRLNTLKARPSLNLRRTSTANSSRPASSAGLRSAKAISPSAHFSKHRRSSSYNSPHSTSKETEQEQQQQRRQSNIGRPMTPSGAALQPVEVGSPIGRETAEYLEKHMEKQRKRQVKEDGKFRKMNARLEDMIRQGKEALGTKVEVEQWSDGDQEMGGEYQEDMPGGW